MTQQDIDEVIAKFSVAADLALGSGFQGVEIHAGREHLFQPTYLNFRTI